MHKDRIINELMCMAGKKRALSIVVNRHPLVSDNRRYTCIDAQGNDFETDVLDESLIARGQHPDNTLFITCGYEDISNTVSCLKNLFSGNLPHASDCITEQASTYLAE